MPTSHTYQINEIMELVILTEPEKVLDIGIGFGKYGFLIYERLNLWYTDNLKNKRVAIDGIEAFSDYISAIQKNIYDTIYIDEALNAFKNISKTYDLILLIDILEHFTREEGEELIRQCLLNGRNLIVSTPKNIGIQKAAFGNIYETHRTQWEKEDFHKFGNYFCVQNHLSYIVYMGKDLERVRKNSFYFKKGYNL